MRIRWTIEEQHLLIEATAQIIFEKNALSLREAFNKAQKKLPPARTREIAALSQVPWLTDSVPARLKELEANNAQTWEQRIAQATREAKEQGIAEGEAQFVAAAGALLAKILIAAFNTPDLAGIFSRLPEVAATPPSVGNGVSRSTKAKKVRVVVAGVLNGQARKIEETFGDRLDIRFWTKDQSTDTLRSLLHQADAAIGMVGFLSHSHDGVLKASKVPYYPVSGGVTAIKHQLEQL
jgi:hypothetical protein